jgi:hypothetical protein
MMGRPMGGSCGDDIANRVSPSVSPSSTRIQIDTHNQSTPAPKVLHRVALALLLQHQPALLKRDNAGELLKALKDGAARVHDRDKLMRGAYKGLGAFPSAKIRRVG